LEKYIGMDEDKSEILKTEAGEWKDRFRIIVGEKYRSG